MPVPTPQASSHLFHNVIVVLDDDEDIVTLITELINAHTSYEVQHHVTGNQTLQAVLPLKMVDKSTSPLQTHLGPVFGDEAVQTSLLSPA